MKKSFSPATSHQRQATGFKRRRLGQHFLAHPELADKLVRLAGITSADTVLEIGPGQGVLTQSLRGRCHKLIAVEYDAKLVQHLKKNFPISSGVDIYQGDILKFNFDLHLTRFLPPKLKVVANLPYKISTEIIFQLIEHRHLFSELWLMIQKEVAERLTAQPGNKDYGSLTLLTGLYGETRSVLTIPPTVFRPQPKVDSAFICMKLSELPRVNLKTTLLFRRLVRHVFLQRRKTLKHTLKNTAVLKPHNESTWDDLFYELGINPQARPEEIPLDGFAALANRLTVIGQP